MNLLSLISPVTCMAFLAMVVAGFFVLALFAARLAGRRLSGNHKPLPQADPVEAGEDPYYD